VSRLRVLVVAPLLLGLWLSACGSSQEQAPPGPPAVARADAGERAIDAEAPSPGGPFDAGAPAVDAAPVHGARLSTFVASEMARHHREGVTIAAVKNGKTVWHRAFGRADLATDTPMADDSVFLMASMSKPVMAIAVMQVAEEVARARGTTVSALLDADVNTLVRRGASDPLLVRHPSHPTATITLRMLMAHVSGISVSYEAAPHNFPVEAPAYALPPGFPDLRTAHAEYLRPGGRYYHATNFLEAAPGTAYEYSSVASSIPAHFVEVATGVSFAEHCRRRIFGPLAMHDTAWRIADLPHVVASPRRLATPYYWDADASRSVPVDPPQWENVYYPAASLRSTAVDYAKLLGALASETSGLLSAESLRELRRVQYPALEPTQGLILYYLNRGGMRVLGHEGYNDGFLTSGFTMVPGEKLPDGTMPTDLWGAVVLTNGEFDADGVPGFLRSVGGEVLKAALAHELD